MADRPISNQQPWRKALNRFSPVQFAFIRSWWPQIIPVVSLGRELPDRERVQFSLSGAATVQTQAANTQNPAVGLSSNVDLRLDQVDLAYTARGPGAFDPFSQAIPPLRVGLGFATSAWNPFGASAGFFQPQFRPQIQNGAFQPGSTVGIEGTAATAPPPLSIANLTFLPQIEQGATFYYAQSRTIDFGPDGLIVPAFTILAAAADRVVNVAAVRFNTLWATFRYRELDS